MECGKEGACLQYDHDDIALYHFLIVFCVKGGSLFLILGAWKLYKPPKKDQTVQLGEDVTIGAEKQGVVSPVFEPDTPNGSYTNINTVSADVASRQDSHTSYL